MGHEGTCLKKQGEREERKGKGKEWEERDGEGEKERKEELKEEERRGEERRGNWPYSLHTTVVYVCTCMEASR